MIFIHDNYNFKIFPIFTLNNECSVAVYSGRRVCLGEQLARQELFIFFSTLMHFFHVRLPDGVTPDFEPEDKFVMKPKPYQIIFESRL